MIMVFYNLRFLGIPLNARQFLRTTFTQIICVQIEPFQNVIRTRFTVSRCKTEIQQNISKRNQLRMRLSVVFTEHRSVYTQFGNWITAMSF